MICVSRDDDGAVNQNDVKGLFDIKWGGSNYKDGDDVNELSDFALDSQLIGGELQGLLAMRDGNNYQYFHGKSQVTDSSSGVYGVEEHSDGSVTMSVKVDADYLKDMTKAILPETGSIKVGAKTYKYDSWGQGLLGEIWTRPC